MSTLIYTPDVRIIISSVRQGNIDVSADIAGQGNVVRLANGVSQVTFQLRNNRRKYDNVFVLNDRIEVWLKRFRWVPVLTGYLSQVPVMSAYPRDVRLQAHCSLKRLVNFLWDPGAPESVDLLTQAANPSGSIREVDSGMRNRVVALLTRVAGWEPQKIHVGGIPPGWITQVQRLWGQIEDDLAIPAGLLGEQSIIAGQGGPSVWDIIGGGGDGGGGGGNQTPLPPGGGDGNHPDQFGPPRSDPYYVQRWEAVAMCESSGNWQANTGNGFYGGLQFLLSTWRSVGGTGYPHQASKTEQINRAEILRSTQGVAPWPICGRRWLEWRPNRSTSNTPTPTRNPDRQTTSPGASRPTGTAERTRFYFPIAGHYSDYPSPGGGWGDSRDGGSRDHRGIDIGTPEGTTLVAIEDGTIFGCHHTEDGNAGGIRFQLRGRHSGRVWFYAHCQRLFVNDGDSVRGGQRVALADSTGTSSGSHLHLGATAPGADNIAGNEVNPLQLLREIERNGTILSSGGGGSDTGQPGGAAGGAGDGLQVLVGAYDWVGTSPTLTSSMLVGRRATMNDEPIFGMVQKLMNVSMRSFCSAPNGDLIGWFPDYYDMFGVLGRVIVEDIELIDFTVTWTDEDLKTHQFVIGSPYSEDPFGDSPGSQVVQLYQMTTTTGVASVEFPQLLEMIFGSQAHSRYPIDVTNSEEVLQRFGARVSYEHVPYLRATEYAEFFLAVYKFMANWSAQFHANISLTFMPELYPGMLLVVPSMGVQLYIETVTHTWDYSDNGGFRTQVSVIAPSALDGSGLTMLPQAGSLAA